MIISRAATNTYAYCIQGIVLTPLHILTHSIFIPIRCINCCNNSYFLHTRTVAQGDLVTTLMKAVVSDSLVADSLQTLPVEHQAPHQYRQKDKMVICD